MVYAPQDQPTTLVYADVISFKQNSHVPLCSPTENRVEYAQLKGYTGKLDLESPDKTHSIGMHLSSLNSLHVYACMHGIIIYQ